MFLYLDISCYFEANGPNHIHFLLKVQWKPVDMDTKGTACYGVVCIKQALKKTSRISCFINIMAKADIFTRKPCLNS